MFPKRLAQLNISAGNERKKFRKCWNNGGSYFRSRKRSACVAVFQSAICARTLFKRHTHTHTKPPKNSKRKKYKKLAILVSWTRSHVCLVRVSKFDGQIWETVAVCCEEKSGILRLSFLDRFTNSWENFDFQNLLYILPVLYSHVDLRIKCPLLITESAL